MVRQKIVLIEKKDNLINLGVIVCKAEKHQPYQCSLGNGTPVNISISIGQFDSIRGGAKKCGNFCSCRYTRLNRLESLGVKRVIVFIRAKNKTTRAK